MANPSALGAEDSRFKSGHPDLIFFKTKCYSHLMRKCKLCNETKPLEKFALASKINGVQYVRHLCVSCYSRSKKPRKDKIKKWYYDIKKKHKCKLCGNSDYRVLEFDHIDPTTKEFDISEGFKRGYSQDLILMEMAKCQVLCANCHRIKTFEKYNDC